MSAVEASPNLRDFLRIKDEEACSGSRRRDLAELFLQTAIAAEKQSPPLASRTLLDIIRDEDPNAAPRKAAAVAENCSKDRKSWRSLKDKLRLKRSGAAWISTDEAGPSNSSAHRTCRSPITRHDVARPQSTVRVVTDEATRSVTPSRNSIDQVSDGSSPTGRRSPARRSSTRFGSLVPISIEPARFSDSAEQTTRQTQLRFESSRALSSLDPREVPESRAQPSPAHEADEPARGSIRLLSVALAEERQLSAREAEAAREATAAATTEEQQPVRMSLMDLLEETEREMGLAGTSYETVGEEEEVIAGGGGGGVEQSCCVCMVRNKGAAFIPCGHTFCRVCSRELWVSRGNCPLCNNHIVEILDIF